MVPDTTSIPVPQLSYQNHFQFGYDDQPFLFRTRSQQKWWVSYGRCLQEPLSFYEECKKSAQTIASLTRQKLWILFSGGVDSEVVLRSFVLSGIPVHVAIARFKHDLNLHDIAWAVSACEELQVPYQFFDLDLLNFWQTRAHYFAEISQCISPQLVVIMWLSDQINGYPIIGSGENLFVREDQGEGVKWLLYEKERIASWYRFFLARGRDACPGFFQFRPELMLSHLQDPLVNQLVNNKIPMVHSSQEIKLQIYRQHFSLKPRPKYTGFEKVQSQDAILRSQLKQMFPDSDEIYKTEWRDLKNKIQYHKY